MIMEFVDPLGDETAVEAHRRTVSEAIRKLSETAGVPEDRRVIERPSGAPFVVTTPPVGLKRHGITTEIHNCGQTDGHPRHLWQPGSRTEWFTCDTSALARVPHLPTLRPLTPGERVGALDPDAWTTAPLPRVFEDYCNHPNGFGPMGCPCGASADDSEDEIRFRHIPTGEDEVTQDCPTCRQLVPCGILPQHLREVHILEWPESRVQEFMKEYDLTEVTDREYDPTARCSMSPECRDLRFTWESALRTHLVEKHRADEVALERHLDNPWREGEDRADWKNRTFHQNYGMSAKGIREAMSGEELADRMQRGLVPRMVTDMQNAMASAVDRFLSPEVLVDVLADNPHAAMEQQLTEWWMDRAEEEARTVIPKAVAYGSNSLLQLGRKMAQLKGREVSDEEAMELGCWVYAVGKIERWTDAVMRGERPSDDSIYDLGIYVKMVQRIRHSGSWPGV